ncbi:uncharacterized protein LOC129584826 isoform X1 [Paramacrobiotus metropolitanus]|uniref:uncharacterized protein LOC129584826 isoform X1 n=1 Tax=Paramacrobiotus metropolitanus TaxID=2943436 RepID=UPI002446118A|nr:uncharacterized protein LOC129584826 isoform X1 [Paramacrobiotus metropolitanus]
MGNINSLSTSAVHFPRCKSKFVDDAAESACKSGNNADRHYKRHAAFKKHKLRATASDIVVIQKPATFYDNWQWYHCNRSDEMVVEDSYPDIRTVARDSVHYDLDPTGLLITPRKPLPPGRDNPDMRELHRELAFNNKMGINVLGQKSELQKAMEKMRGQVTRKQLEEEKKNQRSDLEREFEKRAMRLKDYENAVAAEPAIPYQPVDEFHRMHAKVAKVNGRFASATS